jgi:TRAP transporter TAXI family solute receptor
MLTNTLAAESVGMVTGSTTGTYIQFGKDIAAISKKSGVTIIVKPSKGSVDNIRRMSSSENAAFAIVQSDVLGYLSKSNNAKFRSYAKRLRLIYPFYNEEVHLLARKTIKTLEDLQGKTIAVGPKSSGTNMTAWNILKIAQIKPAKRLNISVDEGISRVLQGEVDAAFVVAGKPRKGFSNLFSTPKESVKTLLQQVHFVALDDSALLAEYVRSDLSHQDYDLIEKTVPTIAVKALLVTYDFSSGSSAYYKKRCHQLATIGQSFIHSPAFHIAI